MQRQASAVSILSGSGAPPGANPYGSESEPSQKLLFRREVTPPADDVFGQAVASAGIEINDLWKTKTSRWSVLILVSVTGAFASGPIASWPVLEPILISENVFEGPYQNEYLSRVFSIATGITMVGTLIAGILYDIIGPRGVAALGAWGCAVCLFMMAVAVKAPSLNFLLWIFYPGASFFGNLNTFGVYGWFWMLPEDQNTVASFTGAIQVLSDSFVLLAVWLHSAYGLSMSFYFTLVSVLAVFAGFVAYWFVPTLEENVKHAAAVVQFQSQESSDTAYGTLGGKGNMERQDSVKSRRSEISTVSPQPVTLCDGLRQSGKALKDTVIVMFGMYPMVNILFVLYSFFNYMWSVYPEFEMYPLYDGLLGPQGATRLVNVFGGLYPVVGMVSLLFFGKFVDVVGYIPTLAILLPPTILNTYWFSLKSFDYQVAAQVLLSFFANTWYVISPRFCLYYSPFELFGSFYGLNTTLLGVGQMLGTPLSTFMSDRIVSSLNSSNLALPYIVTIYLWCVLYVASTFFMFAYWWYYPIPEIGSITMSDIRAFRSSRPFRRQASLDPAYRRQASLDPACPRRKPTRRQPEVDASSDSCWSCWACPWRADRRGSHGANWSSEASIWRSEASV